MESVQWPVCTEEDTIALPRTEEGAAWFSGAGGAGLDILKLWTCGHSAASSVSLSLWEMKQSYAVNMLEPF